MTISVAVASPAFVDHVGADLARAWERAGVRARFAKYVAIEGARATLVTARHGLLHAFGRPQVADDRARASALREYLLAMGPLYVKAGQVLGTQVGLFSETAVREFRQLFSDLPPMSDAELERTLQRSFGALEPYPFVELERSPLAVGTVAQVHRARLRDGSEVAIKLVKEGVRERLESSAWLMERALRVAHALSASVAELDVAAHFAELKPLLVGQCDMLAEARAQHEIWSNFRGHPYLTVPLPRHELCTRDALVMDLMHGTRGQDFESVSFSHPELARRLQEILYSMVFFHGVFHLDPHPGNVFFTDEGALILLDFGLVGRLSEDDKWQLSAFYYACTRREWRRAVECFTRAFVKSSPELEASFEAYVAAQVEVLRKHFEVRSLRWSTMSFFDDANRVLARYHARFTTRFSLLGLAFLTGEGFISQVNRQIDIWFNARRFTDRFSPYMSAEIAERFESHFRTTIPRSFAHKALAERSLVAPTHLDRYVLPSAFPLLVQRAHGSRIVDVDGNEYIDLSCGYGPHLLGYAHPVVVKAVAEAAERGAVNALGSPAELEHADLIASAFAPNQKLIFSNSGTEAALMAFRLARAYTGRQRIAKFEGHYHGFSDQGMVSSWFRFKGAKNSPEPVQGSAGADDSVVAQTLILQYGEPSSFERLRRHAAEIAAVIVEPMPSALAVVDTAFLRTLRECCSELGILLIYDEVVSGFRVCWGGAQHLAGVFPDLTCLGKVIGGGLPCGAVVGDAAVIDTAKTSRDPFVDVDSKAFVGGTMSGNSISCAAGLHALRHLSEHPEIYSELARRTDLLVNGVADAARRHGVACSVKGQRSILAIGFDYGRAKLVRERLAGSNFKANVALSYYMRKRSVYVPELHTLMLSAAHTDSDIEQIVAAFDESVREMMQDGLLSS